MDLCGTLAAMSVYAFTLMVYPSCSLDGMNADALQQCSSTFIDVIDKLVAVHTQECICIPMAVISKVVDVGVCANSPWGCLG